MNNFCDNRIFGSTEIKAKKKSIKRHSRLVRKGIAIKKLKRRHFGGWRGRFVYNNNFLGMLNRTMSPSSWDNIPFVSCIASYHNGDWGLENRPYFCRIDVDTLEEID